MIKEKKKRKGENKLKTVITWKLGKLMIEFHRPVKVCSLICLVEKSLKHKLADKNWEKNILKVKKF